MASILYNTTYELRALFCQGTICTVPCCCRRRRKSRTLDRSHLLITSSGNLHLFTRTCGKTLPSKSGTEFLSLWQLRAIAVPCKEPPRDLNGWLWERRFNNLAGIFTCEVLRWLLKSFLGFCSTTFTAQRVFRNLICSKLWVGGVEKSTAINTYK